MIDCTKCRHMFHLPDSKNPDTMFCSASRKGKESRMYCATINAKKNCNRFKPID